MSKLTVVTTSWDDGDPKDFRVAEALGARGLPGTFYVPIKPYEGKNRLDDGDLRMLSSQGYEIGAHSITHKDLSQLSRDKLVHEIGDCKDMMEQVLGKRVLMFCYPNGRYNHATIRQVREAGYKGARSTRMLSSTTSFSAFEMPTTVQAYPHRGLAYVRNQARAKSISGLTRYVMKLNRFGRWVELGKELFNQVLKNGGIWHLYGHSWEIEQLGMWSELSAMLSYVAGHKNVDYVTNGQLSLLLQSRGRV